MLEDPIFYVHTKVGEDIWIVGIDMPPRLNLKQRRNSTSGSNFDTCHPLGTYV